MAGELSDEEGDFNEWEWKEAEGPPSRRGTRVPGVAETTQDLATSTSSRTL